MENIEKLRELVYQMRAIFNGKGIDAGVEVAQEAIDLIAKIEEEAD
jgi:hypothetical protein